MASLQAKINTENGWIGEPDSHNQVYQLPLDYESQQMLQQAKWWGNNFTLVSFSQTAVHEAIVACALERHRLATGALPESLEVLVPVYLSRVPTDVLRGRSLVYHKNDHSYTLRGVGPNLRDDHEKKASDDWVWSFGTNAPVLK